ncbi:MAG: dienelactone hydrolase family protein [Gammaproteobacteria bacterium]
MRICLPALLMSCLLVPAAYAADPGAEEYTEAMAREHAGDAPVPAAASGEKAGHVAGGPVEYGDFTGYLARPEGEPRAGLIVIHEWWGLNDNIREMARRLAAEGYLALAVDLYGGQVASEPGQARELMSAAMQTPEQAMANLAAAFGWLTSDGGVTNVGSIGWCFGGGMSLRTALMLPTRLDAAVIYYGRLVTDPAELAPLQMPILGIFGGQDQGIPVESVRAFESALEELGKDAEIVIYPEADHAFANPSGRRYDPDAAADAWRRTLNFLAGNLAATP